MIERAALALNRSWHAIGCDVFMALAGENVTKAERITLKRADVIDHVTSCGFKGGFPEMYGNDDEAIDWLEQQSKTKVKRVLRLAFPYKTYCM